MMWLWLSTVVILVGGELDAEMEYQTARDTTTGPPKPLGGRGARVADTVGAAQQQISLAFRRSEQTLGLIVLARGLVTRDRVPHFGFYVASEEKENSELCDKPGSKVVKPPDSRHKSGFPPVTAMVAPET